MHFCEFHHADELNNTWGSSDIAQVLSCVLVKALVVKTCCCAHNYGKCSDRADAHDLAPGSYGA